MYSSRNSEMEMNCQQRRFYHPVGMFKCFPRNVQVPYILLTSAESHNCVWPVKISTRDSWLLCEAMCKSDFLAVSVTYIWGGYFFVLERRSLPFFDGFFDALWSSTLNTCTNGNKTISWRWRNKMQYFSIKTLGFLCFLCKWPLTRFGF